MPDKRRDEEQLPPIPDGGLSESMPEWLRRPPAWRTLPDTEVAQPELERSDGLPEADTSVIDPRAFLTDDDLPEWLRRFGASARTAEPERVASAQAPKEVPEAVAGATADGDRAREGPSRFTPRAPVLVGATHERSPTGQVGRPSTTPPPTTSRSSRRPVQRAAWWQGPQLAILLAVALVIALIVITILVI